MLLIINYLRKITFLKSTCIIYDLIVYHTYNIFKLPRENKYIKLQNVKIIL